jgi:CAAX prenyl protease-like protein
LPTSYQSRWPSLPYVLPFAVFVVFLGLQQYSPMNVAIDYPLRVVILTAVLWGFSRHVIDLRSSRRLETVMLGVAVFVIWVAPDILFPSYRQLGLFQNSLLGRISTKVPEGVLTSPIVLWSRIIRAVALVPILEELFWRAWLMRWIISPKFQEIKLGAYSPAAFWITAVLFASEHGSYWDVGLIAGIAYNWWMIRTKSLGDCILAHAVTNACLCGYVVATHHWEYWN